MSEATPTRERETVFALVGHCGADSHSLSHVVRRAVPGATVKVIDSETELNRHPGAVLLINRVLDGTFAAATGVDLIRALAGREPRPAMVLISNYADAQDAAVSAGARPGFGKSELGSAKVTAILKSLVTKVAAPTP